MSTSLTLFVPDHAPKVVVSFDPNGDMFAGFEGGTGMDRQTCGLHGTPTEVLALLAGLTSLVRDQAVAAADKPCPPMPKPLSYTPTGPVLFGVELATGREACCGAGADRPLDDAHFAWCPGLAADADKYGTATIHAERADAAHRVAVA
jgi:hypothetical protein